MDSRDRQAIEGLFDKLREVERQSPPRDTEAEAFIRSEIGRQPAAPYFMAQTIIVQQRALEAAESRMEQLEAQLGIDPSERNGGAQQGGPWRRTSVPVTRGADRGYAGGYGGGGFLAGAAQTALGVAGGFLLGNMIGGLFGAGDAEAAEAPADDGVDDAGADADTGSDFDSGGGDFGDFGDF